MVHSTVLANPHPDVLRQLLGIADVGTTSRDVRIDEPAVAPDWDDAGDGQAKS